MGHEQQGGPVIRAQLEQDIDNLLAGTLVEISGRLVGEQDSRIDGEGAGQCDPLLLTARELARCMIGSVGETDLLECRGRLRADVAAPGEFQWQHYILQCGEAGHQLERLENEADTPRAQAGATILVQTSEGTPEEPDITGRRRIETRKQPKQG